MRIALLLALSMSLVSAEVITLRDGRVFTGTYSEATHSLATEIAGLKTVLTVPPSQIASRSPVEPRHEYDLLQERKAAAREAQAAAAAASSAAALAAKAEREGRSAAREAAESAALLARVSAMVDAISATGSLIIGSIDLADRANRAPSADPLVIAETNRADVLLAPKNGAGVVLLVVLDRTSGGYLWDGPNWTGADAWSVGGWLSGAEPVRIAFMDRPGQPRRQAFGKPTILAVAGYWDSITFGNGTAQAGLLVHSFRVVGRP